MKKNLRINSNNNSSSNNNNHHSHKINQKINSNYNNKIKIMKINYSLLLTWITSQLSMDVIKEFKREMITTKMMKKITTITQKVLEIMNRYNYSLILGQTKKVKKISLKIRIKLFFKEIITTLILKWL